MSACCAAFSATKVHEYIIRQKNGTDSKYDRGNKMPKATIKEFLGTYLDPHHYSTKMMNSIWGLYNRYAPHAFQKNEEFSLLPAMPQQARGQGASH